MVDNTVEKSLLYKAFVEEMARFTTPYDPAQVKIAREQYAMLYRQSDQGLADDEIVQEMLTSDEEADDASTFWEMIRRAREILAHE